MKSKSLIVAVSILIDSKRTTRLVVFNPFDGVESQGYILVDRGIPFHIFAQEGLNILSIIVFL